MRTAIIAAVVAPLATAPSVHAADVVKASNTTALNLAGSWVSGGPPGAGDVAVWDSTLGGANSTALGGSLSVAGLKVTNPSGAITIANTAGATLTLGSSGIDMSQALQNLTINPNIAIGANQDWTVAGDRTLTGIAGAGTSSGSGTGNIIMSRSTVSGFDTGVATIVFNQNGNLSGSQTGWSNYSGNITVNANVKVQSQGNAAVAFGTGTITLAGGEIAQTNGTWTFGNAIDVTADSVIGNDSSNGLGRTLKLLGDLTSSNGSGLTFTNNVTGGTRTDVVGFLLSGTSASTYGTTTISANSRVRVGGNATATVAGDGFNAGTRGSLGTGDVTLVASTSELAFTRTDAHTVANRITGAGTVVIGGTSAALAGTATQAVTLTGSSDYSGNTTVLSGTLKLGGSGVLGAGSYAGSISNGGVLHFDSTATQTLSGVLSGTGAILKSNAGTLIITANSECDGPVTIDAGTLQIGNGSTSGFLGNDSAITNNASLVYNRSNETNIGNAISGTGSLTKLGAGTTSLNGANSYSGTTTVSAGTLRVGNGGTTGSLGTGPVVNDAALLFNRTDAHTVANNIAGTGTLLIGGTTTQEVTLTGTNTYSGTTTITTGTLQVGAGGTAGTLGSGSVVNNAALRFNRSDDVTVANAISGSGSLTKAAAGTVSLTGASTYTGATIVSAGTLALGNGGSTGSLADASAIEIATGATLHWNRSNSDTGIANAISGAGTVLKSGVGEIAFTGSNAFTGTLDIQAGKLALSGANSENGAPNVNVGAAGTLSLGTSFSSGTATIGNLSGSGLVDPQFGGSNDTRTLSVTGGTFAGRLTNATTGSRLLALTKTGLAPLSLTGSNTYTGATTVSGGALLVNGSLAAGSTVTVQAAGTLGGSGTIGGATTIFGTHSPGTSPGVQTFGDDLAYDGAAVIWELTDNTDTQTSPTAVFDQVIVGGDLDFTTATSLALVFNEQTSTVDWTDAFWDVDQEWLLYDVAGTTSNVGNLTITPESWLDGSATPLATVRPNASFGLRQDSGSGDVFIVYAAVPEPSALALAAAGIVGLIAAARRRRLRSWR